MIKRKFGMACLNITQGRYGGYSHATINAYDLAGMDTGIDRFKTFNDLTVIGVHPLSTTGFANTVHFYDAENDVTIAMTHCNTIPSGCVVGNVFHSGDTIYYEGTAGQATGNHIHLEIGQGKQASKVKSSSGVWSLTNFINIEDYFYIDQEYTDIKDDGGYSFSFEATGGETVTTIPMGYSTTMWNNNLMHMYRQDVATRDIGMMSASGDDLMKAVQTIDEIDDKRTHYAKMNCNYFINVAGDRYGEHLGVEQTPTVNAVPRQDKNYLALWIDNDNKPHVDYSDNYWLNPPNDVKLACTPACVMLLDGEDMDLISVGLGDKRNTANTQSMLLRLPEDGSYVFVVTGTANFNAYNCRQFAKDMGSDLCVLFDSGRSSQLIADGQKKVYTGRKIANVLTLFAKGTDAGIWESSTPEQNEPQTEPDKPSQGDSDELEQLKAQVESLQSQVDALEQSNDLLTGQITTAELLLEQIQKLIEEYKGDEKNE